MATALIIFSCALLLAGQACLHLWVEMLVSKHSGLDIVIKMTGETPEVRSDKRRREEREKKRRKGRKRRKKKKKEEREEREERKEREEKE